MKVVSITCSALLVSGCGLSDHYTVVPVPAFLRYEARKAPQEHPDVLALAKESGQTLFGYRPEAIQISTPLYVSRTRTWGVCARAANHPEMYVTLGRNGFEERRRSTSDDGCSRVEYTEIRFD